MRIYIFLLLLILCTCKEKKTEDTYDQLILGDWLRLSEYQLIKLQALASKDSLAIFALPVLPPSSINSLYEPFGYGFYKDSVDYFKGFILAGRDTTDHQIQVDYLGNFTRYILDKDTLKIFNKKTNNFIVSKIRKLTSDTLVLQSTDSISSTYLKLRYNTDTLQRFDKVIISSFACYGSCPTSDIMIDKNGHIVFSGQDNVSKLGFYTGKLSEQHTRYIFDKFIKADIKNIDTEFSSFASHGQTITTAFIVDDKIYKTIRDYDLTATPELVWAYIPAHFAFTFAEMQKIEDQRLPFYKEIRFYDFLKGDSVLDMHKAESFWLWNELRNAKPTQQSFSPIFSLSFNYPEYFYTDDGEEKSSKANSKSTNVISDIKTDGRFYQFISGKKSLMTLDLGYNFIEANLGNRKIRAIEEWEK